jgi:hypothetical protein
MAWHLICIYRHIHRKENPQLYRSIFQFDRCQHAVKSIPVSVYNNNNNKKNSADKLINCASFCRVFCTLPYHYVREDGCMFVLFYANFDFSPKHFPPTTLHVVVSLFSCFIPIMMAYRCDNHYKFSVDNIAREIQRIFEVFFCHFPQKKFCVQKQRMH